MAAAQDKQNEQNEQNEQNNIKDAIDFLVKNGFHNIETVKPIFGNLFLPEACKIYLDKKKRDFYYAVHGRPIITALYDLLVAIHDFIKTFDHDDTIREAPFLVSLLVEIDEETIQFVEEFIACVKKLSN